MNRKLFVFLLAALAQHEHAEADNNVLTDSVNDTAGPVNGPATETDALRLELEQLRQESAKLKAENEMLRQSDQPEDEKTGKDPAEIGSDVTKMDASNDVETQEAAVQEEKDEDNANYGRSMNAIIVETEETDKESKRSKAPWAEDIQNVAVETKEAAEEEGNNEHSTNDAGGMNATVDEAEETGEENRQSNAPWTEEDIQNVSDDSSDNIREFPVNLPSPTPNKRWRDKVSGPGQIDVYPIASFGGAEKAKQYKRQKRERTNERKRPNRPVAPKKPWEKPNFPDISSPTNNNRRDTSNGSRSQDSQDDRNRSYLDTIAVLGAAFVFGLFVRKGLGSGRSVGSQRPIGRTIGRDEFYMHDYMYCNKMA